MSRVTMAILLPLVFAAQVHAGPAEKAARIEKRLSAAEHRGAWEEGSRADRIEDRIDRREDVIDRREDRRDRRVTTGRRDLMEDRLDRAENRIDRAENRRDRQRPANASIE